MAKLASQSVKLTELAGEKIQTVLTQAPGNGAPLGGLKVVAESGWFAARPSGTENIYKIYAESFRGADHLRRILDEAPDDCQRRTGRVPAAGRDALQAKTGRRNHEQTKHVSSHPIYNLLPTDVKGFDSLAELALDMRWSWNHATDQVWQLLIPRCGPPRRTLRVVLQNGLAGPTRATAGRSCLPQER